MLSQKKKKNVLKCKFQKSRMYFGQYFTLWIKIVLKKNKKKKKIKKKKKKKKKKMQCSPLFVRDKTMQT